MSYRLHVAACSTGNRTDCKSINETEEWIKTISIEHWVLEQTIDFNLYNQKPVQTHQRLVSSDILSSEITKRQFSYLAQNVIACYDNLLNFYA